MKSSDRYAFVNQLLKVATSLSRFAMWVAGGLTLASAIYISADVIARKFLSFSLGGSDELSGYAFAISISWALSFATLQRANIRIDALYQLLPVRISAMVDWIALVCLGVFIVFLTRYAGDVAGQSWANNSTANTILATPLWIPQYLWVAGLVWLCVVLALMLLRSSLALVTGDLDTVHRICGIRSTREEAEEEAVTGERMVRGEAQ
ncbi:TRAP transporter small permease [Candidimonas sp. SYP-B2681]|uniref:TRAP transporter small permease subunit n=1 Tax=Candidimonas sp. SYP-B2681 TaxID=2497686 RepID=UPI000F87745F|nr:TRAP transporter small permease [Candidimonas sp. SYP-B2681]RTZ41698.1 TRAP transporter small permease [Candidimonas sp. SYP-B2681]